MYKHNNKGRVNSIPMGSSPKHWVLDSHFRKNRSSFAVDELVQPFLCSHLLRTLSCDTTQTVSWWLLAVCVAYSLLTCSPCALQTTWDYHTCQPLKVANSFLLSSANWLCVHMFFLALLLLSVLRESLPASFGRRSCCHLWTQLIRITFAFKYSIFGTIIRPKGYVVLSDKLGSQGCLLSPQTGAD